MGQPLWSQATISPGSALVVVLCVAVWARLRSVGLTYTDVGLSYDNVQQRQLWRVVSSQISHIDLLHLVFNISSIWSLRRVEARGTVQYLHCSLIFLLLTALVYLLLLHVMIHVLHRENFRHMVVVGYSGVVFAWMTLVAADKDAKFSVLGLVELPMLAAPFASLALTSLIFPQASFLGHLSGIAVGLLQAFVGVCDWISPQSLLGLMAWTAALMLLDAVRSRRIHLPFLQVQPAQDEETGNLLVSH